MIMEQPNREGHVHGYARMSTTEQCESRSLEDQERRLRQLAQAYYADRQFILWMEPDAAGSTALTQRKTGEKMIAALRAGDIVIASSLDRLFRDVQDAVTQIAEFSAKEVGCILLDLGPTPIGKTGAGQLLFHTLDAFAQFERPRLHDRLSENREGRRNEPAQPENFGFGEPERPRR
jgi:DNA invertase Pin-like site-specific DNA recombinase